MHKKVITSKSIYKVLTRGLRSVFVSFTLLSLRPLTHVWENMRRTDALTPSLPCPLPCPIDAPVHVRRILIIENKRTYKTLLIERAALGRNGGRHH